MIKTITPQQHRQAVRRQFNSIISMEAVLEKYSMNVVQMLFKAGRPDLRRKIAKLHKGMLPAFIYQN